MGFWDVFRGLMLWKLRERVTAQVTDGASFFVVTYQSLKVLWAFLSLQARRKRFVGIFNVLQAILLPGTDLFLAVPLMKCQKENCWKKLRCPVGWIASRKYQDRLRPMKEVHRVLSTGTGVAASFANSQSWLLRPEHTAHLRSILVHVCISIREGLIPSPKTNHKNFPSLEGLFSVGYGIIAFNRILQQRCFVSSRVIPNSQG